MVWWRNRNLWIFNKTMGFLTLDFSSMQYVISFFCVGSNFICTLFVSNLRFIPLNKMTIDHWFYYITCTMKKKSTHTFNWIKNGTFFMNLKLRVLERRKQKKIQYKIRIGLEMMSNKSYFLYSSMCTWMW